MKKIIFSILAISAINLNILADDANSSAYRQLLKNISKESSEPNNFNVLLPAAVAGLGTYYISQDSQNYRKDAVAVGLAALATSYRISKHSNWLSGILSGLLTYSYAKDSLYLSSIIASAWAAWLTHASNASLINRAQELYNIYPLMVKDQGHPDWKLYSIDLFATYEELSYRYNSYFPWNWGPNIRDVYFKTKKLVEMMEKPS